MNRTLIGYRNMLGLTQAAMAVKLKISTASYCNKENGNKDFTQTEMQNIMSLLKEKHPNLTMDEIFLRV